MNKKIIVFGGAGFIGSFVIEELLKKNYDVLAVDINKSKYIPKSIYEQCDILDRDTIKKTIKEHKPDYIYNFAGFANLDDAIANPIRAIELNILGNLNILDACKEFNIKRFIYASSAYAMSEKGSFYGISKLSSEKLIEEYNRKFG